MEKFLGASGNPVKVTLVGRDGNAFAILGACMSAARTSLVDPIKIKAFEDEATSGDYNHLLVTCMDCFDVN